MQYNFLHSYFFIHYKEKAQKVGSLGNICSHKIVVANFLGVTKEH